MSPARRRYQSDEYIAGRGVMDRRLALLLMLAQLSAPLAAEAQPPTKVRIGYLSAKYRLSRN